MLEIIMLIFLTRKIGEIVEEKGRKSGWYKLLTVALWIGGEVIGVIIGFVIVNITGSPELLAYLFGILGAAAGAGTAYLIAKSLTPVVYSAPPPPPTFG